MNKPPNSHLKIDPEIDPEKHEKREQSVNTQNRNNPPKTFARATNLIWIGIMLKENKQFQKVD